MASDDIWTWFLEGTMNEMFKILLKENPILKMKFSPNGMSPAFEFILVIAHDKNKIQ